MRFISRSAVAAIAGFLSSVAIAAPLGKNEVPASLKDWLPWAMHGHEALLCPPPYNGDQAKACVWPSSLELRAGTQAASFRFEVQVFGSASQVVLPGEATRWPQDVKANGRAMPVSEEDGHPVTLLAPGRHVVEGSIPWKDMPQDLQLPKGVGSVVLWVDGAQVARAPDAEGRVWLKQAPQVAKSTDAHTVHTTRLVDDQVPLRITTHYDIAISGKAREIELPLALLPGLVAESIDSPLPVRLQDKGKLVVQGRPGNWSIELRARLMSPVQALSLPKGGASEDEVWSFAAHNDVRLVSVEGAASVDPKQVAMPEPWRAYPAYRLRPGDTLKLVQTRRGNPVPNPDSLSIARELWLDFDGQGYTVHDEISGTLSRSSRLELAAPGVLGRAALNDDDQSITRLKNPGPDGLEVRTGAARLSADSRVVGGVRTLPASGWAVDFNKASAVLNLPPGWRLLHAGGVDSADGSWVSRWTLWDFFFVLLSALAAGKLFGWKRGALLGAALVLSWHMLGAPQSLWLIMLACHALSKVLPSGRLLVLSTWAEKACAGLIALVLLPYAVQQVRLSMYPALERPWQTMGEAQPERDQAASEAVDAVMAEAPAPDADGAPPASVSSRAYSVSKSLVVPAPASERKSAPRMDEQDPGAKVQTGPGLPSWQWNAHRLAWQGPVQQAQSLQLVLLPPAGTVVLRLASLALLVTALLSIVGKTPWWPTGRSKPVPAPGAALATMLAWVGAALLMGTQGDARAAEPTPAEPVTAPASALLDELRHKLTAPPDCMPRCADVPRLWLAATGSRIQLRIEAHALADVTMPLPGQGVNWRPATVTVDGRPAVIRRDDAGALWIALSQGVSQVVLEADVGNASAVDISLPLPVREVKSQTQGWTLAGLDARGLASGALSLSREQSSVPSEDRGTQRDALSPFVRVERTFHLGLRWTAETRIQRITPSLAPLRVKVQLVNGESVNDDAVQVQDGVATVQLGANESVAFASTLKESPKLSLNSAKEANQIEVWKLDTSTQWHVALSGIAPVVHQEDGRWMPTWQPWPGEQVAIDVSKPSGVAGQTFTVDRVDTSLNPGARATDVSAQTALRSSQGGNHRFQLPAGAELLAVSVDGQVLPVQQQAGAVMVPITPGAHVVKLDWREPRGMSWWFQSQAVNVGAAGVNDRTSINVPTDRVVLAVGGPTVGPAVLFWGVLIVIIAVAWGLGRSRFTPLGAVSWVLLGLGIAQMSLIGIAVVVGWFLVMESRRRFGPALSSRRWFITAQITVALWGLLAAGVLLETVRVGLLGYPDLMVLGNGSDAGHLHWYADRFAATTAQAWVFSAPVYVYRVVMLLWALWLSASLLKWVKWAWECFSAGGHWRDNPKPPQAPPV
ncbi:MAG: hypothetical protein Q7V20_24245 [Aquabacterium sp.]|uniref:hypothetical protein n=1 Tax=Aquabacterium sp. TaxID=1872578 RepID=UPI0027231A32|nr:hypothetical protein [Aquabacterium sp.]MDO9006567.1 hypothetical protein [Aquabacterium sp.]